MGKTPIEFEGKWYESKGELFRQKGTFDDPERFRQRLRQGMPLEEALTAPIKKRGKPPPVESLAATHPQIAKELHPTKNGDVTAWDVRKGSNKELIWHCPNSKLPAHPHDYPAKIKERTRSDGPTGCPCCAGTIVCPDTCLSFTHPEIAAQWHPTKNGNKKPTDVTYGSGIPVYWLCPHHPDEDWYVSPNHRTAPGRGTHCPKCSNQTSRLEIRIYTELMAIFEDTKWRRKDLGPEIDILIPSRRIGIEVDGKYWHTDKDKEDRNKNKLLEDCGYILVRLREKGLPLIGQYDAFYNVRQSADKAIRSLLLKLSDVVSRDDKAKIRSYLSRKKYANEKAYNTIVARLPAPPVGETFEDEYPKVAKYWDYAANAPLTPDLFAPKSNKVVWWKCSHKDYHPSFRRSIDKAIMLAECEYCLGKKVHLRDSLATQYPDIAKDWDYDKNELRPEKVWPKWNERRYKAFWICSQCQYDWHSSPNNRCIRNAGCSSCYRRTSNKEWPAEKRQKANEKLRRNTQLRQDKERKGLNAFLDRYIALCDENGTNPTTRELLSIINRGTSDAPLDICTIAGYEDLSGKFDRVYRICDTRGYKKLALCWTDDTNTERRLGKKQPLQSSKRILEF